MLIGHSTNGFHMGVYNDTCSAVLGSHGSFTAEEMAACFDDIFSADQGSLNLCAH